MTDLVSDFSDNIDKIPANTISSNIIKINSNINKKYHLKKRDSRKFKSFFNYLFIPFSTFILFFIFNRHLLLKKKFEIFEAKITKEKNKTKSKDDEIYIKNEEIRNKAFIIKKLEKMIIHQKEVINNLISNFKKNDSFILNNTNQFEKIISEIKTFKDLLKKKIEMIDTPENRALKLYSLLSTRKVVGKNKIRIGGKRDGGYVMLDDINNTNVAYSIGVAGTYTFEESLLRINPNMNIFMYDHTISGIKSNNTKLHFKRIGLRSESDNETNYLRTMNQMIIENGHINEKDMVLEIDCEGCEWKSFKDMPQGILEKFSQIIVEYHVPDLNNDDAYKLVISVLEKINLTHQAYHIHINNAGFKTGYGNYFKFSLIEASYVIKRNNSFKNDYSVYPINGLDYPNIIGKQDFKYGLAGFFNFE